MRNNTLYIRVLSLVLIFFMTSTLSLAASSAPLPPLTKKEQKIQNFLQSKFGQWVLKQAIKKAAKKQAKLEAKAEKGNVKAKAKLAKIEETKKQQAALTGNMRLGLILVIVGILLGILPEPINFIGFVAIIIGLVLILIELI